MMSTRTSASILGAIGLLLPLVLLFVDAMSDHGWWPVWILFVWPSSYMLGATSGGWDFGGYMIVGVAIGINGLLYAYVGTIFARVLRKLT